MLAGADDFTVCVLSNRGPSPGRVSHVTSALLLVRQLVSTQDGGLIFEWRRLIHLLLGR